MPKKLFVILILLISGCSLLAIQKWDQRFGINSPDNRASQTSFTVSNADTPNYLRDGKPIIDNRCVVCHGCYDAPCQLKLESMTGLERGANKVRVYDGTRLLAASLTRLYEDANTTSQWRDKGFYPVLNEREQTPVANQQASVMLQMLNLKKITHSLKQAPCPRVSSIFLLTAIKAVQASKSSAATPKTFQWEACLMVSQVYPQTNIRSWQTG